MPAGLGAVFGAIGSAVTAGASAIGSALGGLTLAGVAQGASIASAAFSVVGGITGNKTLQKIGMGLGIVGGGAALANGVRGLAARGLSSVANSADDALSAPIKGSRMVDRSAELWKAPKAAANIGDKSSKLWTTESLVGSQNLPKSRMGVETGETYDPGIEKNMFQRNNSVFGEYAPWLSIAGGMGEAYMISQQMDMNRDIQGRRLDIEQAYLDRLKENTGAVGLNIQPVTYSRRPLLQYNQ